MTKDDYIKRIICEHWFNLKSWKGSKWNDKKKSIWLSGMHRAWNLIFPSDIIAFNEIVMKATIWNRGEAVKWYAAYLSDREDDGSIEARFDILDL